MSTHKVTIEKIATVNKHDNADRLDLCTVESMKYQFVTARGLYKPGDLVIYFPIDSIIPYDLAAEMGVSHLTSNKSDVDGVLIKTVKLRGKISQGMVISPNALSATRDKSHWIEGDDLTDLLGVCKYEPPEIWLHSAKLDRLPRGVSKYDIGGAERYFVALSELMHKRCLITEKVEGSHFAASISSHGDKAGQVIVCCKNKSIISDGTDTNHTWLKVSEKYKLDEFMRNMFYMLNKNNSIATVTIRAELIGPGIQGNYYNLKKHELRLFEIEVDEEPLEVPDFMSAASGICTATGINLVPIISDGDTLDHFLNGRSVAEASNGKSMIVDKLREGIVIRPYEEDSHEDIGRLILKQRSPEYLAKSKL